MKFKFEIHFCSLSKNGDISLPIILSIFTYFCWFSFVVAVVLVVNFAYLILIIDFFLLLLFQFALFCYTFFFLRVLIYGISDIFISSTQASTLLTYIHILCIGVWHIFHKKKKKKTDSNTIKKLFLKVCSATMVGANKLYEKSIRRPEIGPSLCQLTPKRSPKTG